MSDEGEKTCPLCAEEMDLTDQQLRPCKCGYDICVWCWHHIMDMAEKDDTEGRCPACRSPYNKEKIVGTASKCERLVAEMSVEKKQKSQKGKTKTSEGRKQLSSVRVIQRNLVYIVGLPLNLADEDLLQRKEYFGQYGKVLKVSISRTAAGAIQHFANNTCSVYITYSKEDEAVRSIQSVHGFVLDGRPLKACFGTTKYCHAWLRNMPCTNPDCLYLHEFGSQEDSFTKDEIISEYTRGRVQQVTGATTNEMQRRSGNMLPPATDDYSINSSSAWGKPISKTTTNDPANSMRGSPPNSSSGRSASLPAAASWGTTHASNSQPLPVNVASSNGSSKQKADNCSTTASFSKAPSSHGNESIKKNSEESPTADGKSKLENPESKTMVTDHRKTVSDIPAASTLSSHLFVSSEDKDLDVSDEGRIRKLSSDMSSISIGSLDPPFASKKEKKAAEPVINNISVTRVVPDLQNNKVPEVSISEAEADLLSFNDQRLRDPEVVTHTHTSYVQNNIPQSSHLNNNSMGYSPRQHGSLDPPFGNQNPLSNGDSLFEGSNGNGHSFFSSTQGSRNQMGIFDDKSNGGHNNGSIDLGENSIISNILSMDFDPWDESLTSPQHLAKLLGDSNKQQGSQRISGSSRKTQNSNQSRFSFAREEDGCVDQGSNFTQSLTGLNIRNLSHDFGSNTDGYQRQLSDVNGFSSFNFEESERTAGNQFSVSSNKISVSRSQISAPPGFMGPSRAPPPGFTSNERIEQTYDNLSGNHMFENSSLLRKVNQQHQAPAPVYNNGVSELEFMDPAILAIGGRVAGGGVDMRSNFSSQLGAFENDNNRLRLLVQRSFSQQNQRYNEADVYGVSSRIIEQSLPSNRSFYQQQGGYQQGRMSNGHWDGWSEVESSELVRNERLGLSKYYSGGYEDTTKLRMASSGDVYNRRYGI